MEQMCSLIFILVLKNWPVGYAKSCCLFVQCVLVRLPCLVSVEDNTSKPAEMWCGRVGRYHTSSKKRRKEDDEGFCEQMSEIGAVTGI